MAQNRAGGNRATFTALVVLAVAARVVVAALLWFGPWTDEATELAGWDAERFQEIIDEPTKPWAEHPVEYPPGSVLTLEIVGADDVVGTNQNLVALSLAIDLLSALALGRLAGRRAAAWYLVVGVALLPMGYVRLDGLVVGLAIAAALVLFGKTTKQAPPGRHLTNLRRLATNRTVVPFAALAAAGALVKIWPALLVGAALAIGRRGAAAATTLVMAAAGIGWLVWAQAGLEPLQQVLSLRGATGWHVESLPGAIVALLSQAEARLEYNAFRIGAINQTVVLTGRILAVAATVALVLLARRSADDPGSSNREQSGEPIERFGLVVLGSTAALLATAPLLSPQFILWLLPWAALIAGPRPLADPRLVLSAIVAILTGAILGIFGPPNLDETLPALLLTIRNLALLAIPISCGLRLREIPVVEAMPRPRSATSASGDR